MPEAENPLVTGYSNFSVAIPGPMCKSGPFHGMVMIAGFRLDADVSPLFPYINAVAEKCCYHEKPLFIKFFLDGVQCVLSPEECAATPFEDRLQAVAFISTNWGSTIAPRRLSGRPIRDSYRHPCPFYCGRAFVLKMTLSPRLGGCFFILSREIEVRKHSQPPG